MAKLNCKNCGFRFEAERVPEKCPYCAEIRCVEEEKDAKQLLSEIDEIDIE